MPLLSCNKSTKRVCLSACLLSTLKKPAGKLSQNNLASSPNMLIIRTIPQTLQMAKRLIRTGIQTEYTAQAYSKHDQSTSCQIFLVIRKLWPKFYLCWKHNFMCHGNSIKYSLSTIFVLIKMNLYKNGSFICIYTN